ncbi:hypothetical protein HZU83_19715 [Sphaerotilus montanus]|nr:hypothetical protein [Sphaerotilus montanus]
MEVLPGQLDPRLRLAPCQQIDAYLPPGSTPWGRTRVGLRCPSGWRTGASSGSSGPAPPLSRWTRCPPPTPTPIPTPRSPP